jgi:class 3 adenylate cyclase
MLRTTVIAKTDWVHSTNHLRRLAAEQLDQLLATHKQLVARIVVQFQGSVVKGEGDAFWIIFPSVTTAVLAAIEMQREVRAAQLGRPDESRLAMRVVIAAGDLLHRDSDVFGVTMSLVARIDGVTPPDEIYLSQAAWLMLNHAEVKTEFVDAPILKDFEEPEPIYRVLQNSDVAVEENVVVMFTDIGGFLKFVATRDRYLIARVLANYEEITLACCAPHSGKLRSMAGDQNFVTFDSLEAALMASESLILAWETLMHETNLDMPLRIGIHQGDCFVYRAYLFGDTINRAVILGRIGGELEFETPDTIVVSGAVAEALRKTPYALRLRELSPSDLTRDAARASMAALARDRAYLLQLD